MKFKIFKGTMISWKELFQQAAEFATGLGPTRVRNISHSGNHSRGIVTVWYEDEASAEAPAAIPLRVKFDFVRGTMISWDELMEQIAVKASALPPELVVSVSHSDDQGNGVVVLWYWGA